MNGTDRQSGFTLLEVIVAMAILGIFLVPIYAQIVNGFEFAKSTDRKAKALRLAQDKMTELEMLPFPEDEEVLEGDFGDEHPEYSWKMETIKTPDLQMMEEIMPALKAMEVHCYVYWGPKDNRKSLKLSTLRLE